MRPEKLKPSAKLEALLIPLRPVSAELAPLQVSFMCMPACQEQGGLSSLSSGEIKKPKCSQSARHSSPVQRSMTDLGSVDSRMCSLQPADDTSEWFAVQGARDALPRGRTPHALTLTYKLSLVEGGKITPRLPMMNGWGASILIMHQCVQLCGHPNLQPAAYHGAMAGLSGPLIHVVSSVAVRSGLVRRRTPQSPSGCVSA